MRADLAIEFTQVSIMQEYRINYTLLIGLIVGTLICSGAIYGIHKFQNARQSGWLVTEAEKAASEKEYGQAAQYYLQFTQIHPKDMEAKVKLANAYLDVLDQDNPDPEFAPVARQESLGEFQLQSLPKGPCRQVHSSEHDASTRRLGRPHEVRGQNLFVCVVR